MRRGSTARGGQPYRSPTGTKQEPVEGLENINIPTISELGVSKKWDFGKGIDGVRAYRRNFETAFS
jgi:hypothetical protein